jgi:hypothetical protein
MEYILEDGSGNVVETSAKQQKQLVEHLAYLTQLGRICWFRQQIEPTYIYCVLNKEMFEFELTYVNAGEVTPNIAVQEPDGIFGQIRNVKLLWLPGIAGWDNLIPLLKSAQPDDQLFAHYRERCQKAIYTYLKNEVNSCL